MEIRKIEPAPFLERLPLEIRFEIYRYLLSTKYTKNICVDQESSLLAKLRLSHNYQIEPTILRTNHQIHSEAHTVLYHENMFVRVRGTREELGPLMNQGIPKLLKGHQAQRFKYCAMSIYRDHHTSATQIKSPEGKEYYVIASDDVQLLCQSFLLDSVYRTNMFEQSKFTVTVIRNIEGALSDDPAPKSPQRRLLGPLTLLYGAPHFEFAGFVNEKYCASIAARVSRTAPTIKECFDEVNQLMHKGRGDMDRNHLRSAVDIFKMALFQLVHFCIPRTIKRSSWVTYHLEHEGRALGMFTRIGGNLASLHYTLEEFEDAHFWAPNYIHNLPYGPSKDTLHWEILHAKAVYLQAMASTRLGNHQQGVNELCSGLEDVKPEVYRDKELVQWRMQARALIKGRDEGDNVRLLRAMGIEDDDRNDSAPDTSTLEES